MKNSWKKYLSWLISPAAIGIYITLILVKTTFPYYAIAARGSEQSLETSAASLLYLAHQKSIDYRLRVRGPRPVPKNLALLTVDERSIEALGRWPFRREIIAQGIDRLFAAGAKLLALDMIFSEPQLNPASEVLEQLRLDHALKPDVETSLNNYVTRMNGDLVLSEAFKRHADHLVAGSFFGETLQALWPPETEFCRDMIFKRSEAFKLWDHEEVLLSVSDPYQPYMPKALSQLFQATLDEKEKEVRRKLGPAKDKNSQIQNDTEVQDGLRETCNTILDDFRDELNQHWSSLVAEEDKKTFTFPTYDAWLADYRLKSRPNAVLYADNWVLNSPTIVANTKHTGDFNTKQDSDGTIRSKTLLVRSGNNYYPTLALKAFLVSKGFNGAPKMEYNPATGEKEIVDFEVTNNETGKTEMHIPTDAQGNLLINYSGPMTMFPYLSFADLMSDSPEAEIQQMVWSSKDKAWQRRAHKVNKAEFIKDKIFIAGATATGIYDLRVTPFQENFPGTETHLNALENLLERNFFRTLPDEAVKMPIVLCVLGLILSIALSQLGAIWGLALTAGTIGGIILTDQHFLFNRGIVVAVIWPFVLTLSLYVALTFYRYLTEERGKKELRQTFQKYVSPAIVEEILAHPANIELGGRKANLTVFFSDVRGFTTISEKLDPRALSDLLNSYLTPMTDIVFKNRGTLDKYMGDAVMAFFGAPIAYKDHAKWACRCALQSLEKLFELQKEYERKGLPTIDIGIGLNSGDVNVGNMGSQSVRSYTVMGDAVNLASRLEGINKQYGTRIILSEFTYEEVKDSFLCREVDWVRVKGKARPVKIYELIRELKAGDSPSSAALDLYAQGYALYRTRKWSEALELFQRALNITPEDEVIKLYIQRCQDYLSDPPDASWDGVFVMKTK